MQLKLIPRSLVSQIVLWLGGVMLLSQLVMMGIVLSERQTQLSLVESRSVGRRVESIVQILSGLEPDQFSVFIRAVNTPALEVRLLSPDELFSSFYTPADDRRIRRLHRVLSEQLGPLMELRVRFTASDHLQPRIQPGPPLILRREAPELRRRWGEEFRRPPPAAGTLQMQIRLPAGQWIEVISRTWDATQRHWPVNLLVLFTGTLLTMLLGMMLLIRRISQPLRQLAASADRFGRQMEGPPLPETGPTEICRVARAFNLMQCRLQRYISDRNNMLAAISHDLKTPITRLRLRVALLTAPEEQSAFERDLDEMEQMVNETLEFMRGDALTEPAVVFDMNALLESIQEDMRVMSREFVLRGRTSRPCRGRVMALRRMVINLLDNAFRYGENVTLGVEESSSDLILRVSDQGPGIPPDQIDQVFEPFVRLDWARNKNGGGSGLGLGIARNIAHSHGGELTLRANQPTGLIAELRLPVA